METKEKTQIPEFKLAKVGGDRRRKGAGIPWFFGGGSGSAVTGTIGVAGKAVFMSVVTAMGIGAFSLGKAIAPDNSKYLAKKKDKKAFSQYQYKADETSNLPKDVKYGSGSGLAMVSGSLDGKTPEQRAAEAAEAARKAQEEADAAAKAQAEAEQTPENVDGTADAAADPMADLMASAANGAPDKDKKGMGKKFGELSKNLGGGGSRLAGGSGLAGGVTKSFEAPKFKSPATGKALAFSNNRANVGRSRARASAINNGSRGFARRQLDKAFQYSRQASKASDEDSSALADQAFNNNPGAGNVITGAGAGTGRAGAQTTPDANPDGGSSPTYGGSGTESGFDDCNALFPDQGYIQSSLGGCQRDIKGTGAEDPTNGIINMLKMLLVASTAISIIQLAMLATGIGAAYYKLLAQVQVAIGVVICALGLMLVGMGRKLEGAIFAAVGAAMAIFAYAAQGAGTEAAVKEVANKTILKSLASKLAMQTMVSTVGGLGGAAYANNMGERTFNKENQKWE